MSLKAFHIFFITVSVLFFAGLGLGCTRAFFEQRELTLLGLGIAAFGASAGLMVYGVYFLKKLKDVRFL